MSNSPFTFGEFKEKIKELQTQNVPDDAIMLFDTGAASFDVHCINICGVHYIPQDVIGEHTVVLTWENS